MDYRDYTPLETATFDTLDKEEKEYHVVVMRGTFDIGKDSLLVLSEEQKPLVATDEFFGKTNQSGIRQESDFAPYKPRTDILLDATAHAPGGKPSSAFTVGIDVTKPSDHADSPARPYGLNPGMAASPIDLAEWEKRRESKRRTPDIRGPVICSKKLRVTGPRHWHPALFGRWTLGASEPMTTCPIRYDLAFGGMITVYDRETERDRTVFYEQNPIGIGHWPEWTHREAHRRKRVPAPRILDPSDTPEFGKDLIPQGFGPICRSWQPRLALAGTYDEAWQAGRWPHLPHDFDFGYWNCAHPDLQVPFLNGDEEIHLTNLTPDGYLKLTLPGHIPFVLVRYRNGEINEVKSFLDTVFIEPDYRRASLVWRTRIPTEPEVRVMESRISLSGETAQIPAEVYHG
jgi:hypothetical protein